MMHVTPHRRGELRGRHPPSKGKRSGIVMVNVCVALIRCLGVFMPITTFMRDMRRSLGVRSLGAVY